MNRLLYIFIFIQNISIVSRDTGIGLVVQNDLIEVIQNISR